MNKSAGTISNRKRKLTGGKQGQAVWRNTEGLSEQPGIRSEGKALVRLNLDIKATRKPPT